MSTGRPSALVNPAKIRKELRKFGTALLSQGGSECITGDIDDPSAPCIRSVIQIDGDIITEFRHGASSEGVADLIGTHRSDVDEWFRQLHRAVRNAQFWIGGVLTILAATLIAALTGPLASLLGLVGASVLSVVRRLERAARIAATTALVGASIVTAVWSRTLEWSGTVGLWGVSVVLLLVGSAAGYVAQRWVRRQLRAL